MSDVLDAALSLPAAMFGFLLIVVVVYWTLVIVSGSVLDRAEEDGPRLRRTLQLLGLGGPPASITFSMLTIQAWVASVAAVVLLGARGVHLGGGGEAATSVVAVLLAWLGTMVLARLIVRWLPTRRGAVADHIGDVIVVRSGDVGADFGAAELTTTDGEPAVIQVRQAGSDELRAGSTAKIVSYDVDQDVFWVTAFEPDLGTHR